MSPTIAARGGKGGWMPKVSAKQVQRRIVALDAQYTVAQPEAPRQARLAIIAVAAFSSAHRTSSDFSRLTLKHGPTAPAMWGAASTRFKRGE